MDCINTFIENQINTYKKDNFIEIKLGKNINKFSFQDINVDEDKINNVLPKFRNYKLRYTQGKIYSFSDKQIKTFNNKNTEIHQFKNLENEICKFKDIELFTWKGKYVSKHQAYFFQVMTYNNQPFHYYINLKAKPSSAINM